MLNLAIFLSQIFSPITRIVISAFNQSIFVSFLLTLYGTVKCNHSRYKHCTSRRTESRIEITVEKRDICVYYISLLRFGRLIQFVLCLQLSGLFSSLVRQALDRDDQIVC